MTKEELEKQTMEWKNNYILKLEKENAELKKQLVMCNKVYNDNLDYSHHIVGQLTKAKDHIKKLIEAIHIWDCKNLEEVEAEAEQFLK